MNSDLVKIDFYKGKRLIETRCIEKSEWYEDEIEEIDSDKCRVTKGGIST